MTQIQEMQAKNPGIEDVHGLCRMIIVEFVTGDGGMDPAAVYQVIQKGHELESLTIISGTTDWVVRLAPLPELFSHRPMSSSTC